jgi:Glycosyl hydrolase family 12
MKNHAKFALTLLAGSLLPAACAEDVPPPVTATTVPVGASAAPTDSAGMSPGTGTTLPPGTGTPPPATVGTVAMTAGPTDTTVPPTNTVPPVDPTVVGSTVPPVASSTATPPPAAACTNTDKATVPMDATGWVASTCTDYAIQGAWYCFDDGINPSACPDAGPPFDAAAGGMCLQGNTSIDDTYAAWGAGIGFTLNATGETDTMASVKNAYDAASHGIIGFKVVITGETNGLELRLSYTNLADPGDAVSPLKALPGPGEYMVLFADAVVPEDWEKDNSGEVPNDAAIFDVQIQVAGGGAEEDYNFCVTELTPITDGSTPAPNTGTLAAYGSAQCDQYSRIDLGGVYTVQNNRYGGNSHCIQALWDNGDTAGFTLSQVSANVALGAAPGSYPSIVYGWHDGTFYGAYKSAKQLSAIQAIPSKWAFTVPSGSVNYNASYDNWIGTGPTSASFGGTLEQMIWLSYLGTTPIGAEVEQSVSIAGATWTVWYGEHDGFRTVSYIRTSNTTNSDLDLKPFMDDTIGRGYAKDSDYLLGIQAGFEIWQASSEFKTDSYSVSVN